MMKWNVYLKDFNTKSIKVFNVFDSHKFNQEIEQLFKKEWTFPTFKEELRRAAMYCFWSKCEYEVVITSWVPYITKEELSRLNKAAEEPRRIYNVNLETAVKIDIYHQLQLNWHRFATYVWECYHNGETAEEYYGTIQKDEEEN